MGCNPTSAFGCAFKTTFNAFLSAPWPKVSPAFISSEDAKLWVLNLPAASPMSEVAFAFQTCGSLVADFLIVAVSQVGLLRLICRCLRDAPFQSTAGWACKCGLESCAIAANGLVLHTRDRLRSDAFALTLQQCSHGIGGRGLFARFFGRQRFNGLATEFLQLVQHRLHLFVRLRRSLAGGVERHQCFRSGNC